MDLEALKQAASFSDLIAI